MQVVAPAKISRATDVELTMATKSVGGSRGGCRVWVVVDGDG